MDFHSQQQQQHLNSSTHNQQQHLYHHTSIGPDQLPDEDIIEKLFPKCQPKQQQQQHRTENKSNGRLRQQNAGRQHRQQQQQYQAQQQRRQIRSHKIQQHSRRELEARRNAKLNHVNKQQEQYQTPQRQRPHELDNYLSELKQNKAAYYNSSDSSDELSKNQLGKSIVNIRRSATSSAISESQKLHASNSFEHPTTTTSSTHDLIKDNNSKVNNQLDNTGADPTGVVLSSNRNTRSQRAGRRYNASKNLQKQTQRAQQGCGKQVQLESHTNATPLINLSSTEANNNDTHSLSQQQNIHHQRQSFSTSDKQESTTNTAADDSPSVRKVEKSFNRTNRGVVFLVRSDAKATNVPNQLASTNCDLTTRHETVRNTESSLVEHSDLTQEQPTSSIAPSPASAVQSRDQQQQLASNETADSVSEAQLDGKISAIQPITDPSDPIPAPDQPQPKQFNSDSDRYQQTCKQQIAANDVGSKGCQNDEDKYIDLFVYDNSPQLSVHEKSSENREKLSSNTTDSDNIYNCNNLDEARVVSLQNHASHRLLAADQNEVDGGGVVRNDTSVEELCSVNDYSDGIKQKFVDNVSEKTHNNDSSTRPYRLEPEVVNPINSKFILRHHRSVGTLQTVDEKAEIIIEETETCSTEKSTSPKTVGSDIDNVAMQTRNDSIKKGFVPPGFPQRIRPQALNTFDFNNHSPPSSRNDETLQSGKCILDSSIADKTKTRVELQMSADQVSDLSSQMPTISESNLESETDETPKQTPQPIVDGRDTVDKKLNSKFDNLSMSNQSKNDAHILRHHKLPNESSHFSIVKTADSTKDSGLNTSEAPPRSSNVQFSTLSDEESETEVKSGISNRPSRTNKVLDEQAKFTSSPSSLMASKVESAYSNNASTNLPGSPNDEYPLAKSALIFPRLDEGLSSEAESCDDDVEDDDDRAMEADVDANDDDEEDDIDDDVDSPTKIAGGALTLPTNVDSFSRHQQAKGRLLSNLQQSSSSNDLDSQHAKSTMPSYGNYIGLDSLDQNDLKSQTNFSTQNGQPNYWLSNPDQQATTSQPSSSCQFSMQKNNQVVGNSGNNINMTRGINLLNRDDTKAANRLSSDTDNETDRLLGSQRNDQLQKIANNDSNGGSLDHQSTNNYNKPASNSREVLIEGVLFNVKYLGSTHTECEGRGEKEDRITQAEMAVHEVKFRNGESSNPIEVQLFISTEKIMVLDDKHRKIMMDHSLRTISYIADIGNAIVLIVRKKGNSLDVTNDLARSIPKTTCHVFESNESHTITKSISQAFQVAYTELLKANGGDASSYLPRELDYQEVLNSQEMSMTELEMFARKDNQREVIVPKQKGEILGLSIVESGWGSVLPTAVIASLKQDGPAYRCKKLSVGDQILSINGISLVGLALAECQEIIRKTRNQRVARLSVVPCPITVEVKIKRPDTKYQLGFSVQNGVICSLLRGGIAERGGVRVGHRIMSINGTTVVGVPHDKIVTLLASSVDIKQKRISRTLSIIELSLNDCCNFAIDMLNVFVIDATPLAAKTRGFEQTENKSLESASVLASDL